MSENIQEQAAQLKNAISTLESQRETLGEAVVEASLSALRKQLAELEGEPDQPDQHKKLVSLMFVDVVESTKMGQHLEPDEILEIMDGGLQRLAIPIEQHGGRGVNTGMVAIGGFTESADTMMGLTVNLGVRLESAAPPGGLLISHETYQHVRGIFEVDPLPPVVAKGFDEPVIVYLVKETKPRAFRTKSRGVEGISTRMIGREAELKRMQDAYFTAVEDGDCQITTVIGEAGVGKSRILDEFESWLEDEDELVFIFKGRSSPETQEAPYSLLRDMFSYRFQIQGNDRVSTVHQKIEAGIGEALGSDEDSKMRAHLIGQLGIHQGDFRTPASYNFLGRHSLG
jgi:class 3 adenylate cyclase